LQPADTATIRIKLVGLTILTPYYLPRRLLPCHLWCLRCRVFFHRPFRRVSHVVGVIGRLRVTCQQRFYVAMRIINYQLITILQQGAGAAFYWTWDWWLADLRTIANQMRKGGCLDRSEATWHNILLHSWAKVCTRHGGLLAFYDGNLVLIFFLAGSLHIFNYIRNLVMLALTINGS
jgi:hypothetical protein